MRPLWMKSKGRKDEQMFELNVTSFSLAVCIVSGFLLFFTWRDPLGIYGKVGQTVLDAWHATGSGAFFSFITGAVFLVIGLALGESPYILPVEITILLVIWTLEVITLIKVVSPQRNRSY